MVYILLLFAVLFAVFFGAYWYRDAWIRFPLVKRLLLSLKTGALPDVQKKALDLFLEKECNLLHEEIAQIREDMHSAEIVHQKAFQQVLERIVFSQKQMEKAIQELNEKKVGHSAFAGRVMERVQLQRNVLSASSYNNLIYCGLPYNGSFSGMLPSVGDERYQLEMSGEVLFSILEEYGGSMLESLQSAILPACEIVEGNRYTARRIETVEKGCALFDGTGWKITKRAKIRLI